MIQLASLTTNAVKPPLKLAFLGGAHTSAVGRTHRIAIETDGRFQLVAGCFSTREWLNRETAEQYRVPAERVHRNLDELLEKEVGNIDAILILTPTDQHAKQVIRCLDAGFPVICEKALATSSKDVADIKDAVDRNRGFLMVTYNYLGYPMLRELRHMVRNGRFGRIQQVHVEMPQEGFERLNADDRPIVPQDWRLRDGFVPTISLDLGVHLHMMTRYLTDQRPLSVVATSGTYGNFAQIVDNVSCIAQYTDNLLSNLWYSKTALGQRNGLKVRLFGERGSAEWVQEYPENLHVADNHGNKWLIDRASPQISVANQPRYTRFKAGHPAGFIEAFSNYYFDVADALIGHLDNGHTPAALDECFGVEEALEGLRMLEAIATSSKSQAWAFL